MTDELMNGSDTEFIGLRDIELTDNPDNSRVLTPEANVHVIDEWNTHSKGLEANKKMKIRKKKKNAPVMEMKRFSALSRKLSS